MRVRSWFASSIVSLATVVVFAAERAPLTPAAAAAPAASAASAASAPERGARDEPFTAFFPVSGLTSCRGAQETTTPEPASATSASRAGDVRDARDAPEPGRRADGAVASASAGLGDGADASVATADSGASGASVERGDADGGASGASGACPEEMVLVEGDYCPQPKQVCKRWLDANTPYWNFRCAEYQRPVTCGSPSRERKRFCIDREEYVRPGDALPLVHQSWTSAKKVCESQGKRLCLESEWQFACEGEEMRPYPYGFERDATACNIDRMHLGKPQTGLADLRAPTSAYPRCLSPFGVHDMSGNVEEWATLDHGRAPDRSAMKGAWWLPGKNTCRAATLGHGETYEGPQVGVRCCKDAT